MDDRTFESFERGRKAAPLFDCCLVTIPTLMVYPLVLFAGFQMRQLQSRWLAVFGAFLSMAPCSPIVLVGLPIGIWALVVLSHPIVWTELVANNQRPN